MSLSDTNLTAIREARGGHHQNLKHILGQSKGTSRLEPLGDEGFHGIFEALFRIVRLEKLAYLRAKPASKNVAASRLSTAANALRLTVEVGCTKIRHKTASAVLDHIVGTLPTNDQGFCPPLCNDYLKGFRALLEYSSHGEHLRPKLWQAYTDFVLDGIVHHSSNDESTGFSNSLKDSSLDSRNGNHLSVRVSQISGNRSSRGDAAGSIDELVMSLKLLVLITNAPVTSRAADTVETLVTFLGSSSRSHEAAFEALNHVLLISLTEDIALARKILHETIPIIRRLWSSKSSSLRDQMIILLLLGDGFLSRTVNDALALEESLLSSLLATIMHEYSRRPERDVLQLDEILFSDADLVFPLYVKTAIPVIESPRALSNWTTLSVMAALVIGLDSRQQRTREENISENMSRKRLKVSSCVDGILDQAASTSGTERLMAIQLTMFLLDRSEEINAKISHKVFQLMGAVLDDDSSIASWVQVLFSQLTYSDDACSEAFAEHWLQLWSWTVRNLSTSTTCRAASHLLGAILQAGLLKRASVSTVIEDSFFGNGMNGPCGLSDAALSLWTIILTGGIFDTAKSFHNFSVKCIGWLNVQWTFPKVLDRQHNTQMAFHARVINLYKFLLAIVRQSVELKVTTDVVSTSSIYRGVVRASENMVFSRYLLGLDPPSSRAAHNMTSEAEGTFDRPTVYTLQRALLDMLLLKVRSFQEAWAAITAERLSNISSDILRLSTTLCTTSHMVCTSIKQGQEDLLENVIRLTNDFWATVTSFLSQQESEARQGNSNVVASVLLSLDGSNASEITMLARRRSMLTRTILPFLLHDIESQKPANTLEPDLMDVSESFVSHNSQAFVENGAAEAVRQDLPFISDARSASVHFATSMRIDVEISSQTDHVDTETTCAVVDFVQELSPSMLLGARLTLTRFFKLSPDITRLDACRLLEKLAEACLQDRNLERCEAALCLCVHVLTLLVRLWTEEDDELTATASDIYTWFLKVALEKGISSTRVLSGIVAMLQAVIDTKAAFGSESSLPSPRTGLFQILKTSHNSLKYQLAGSFSRIFDHYILTEHDAIFSDVMESLPSDPENGEGIAVRLFVLGELASRWHTVLRRAVYHLFETAAHIPMSSPFAKRCLRRLCHAIQVQGPRQLLHLFSSQILYTWLETESISSIPFEVFEYEELQDLLMDVLDDIVGQIAMRTSTIHADELSQLTGISWTNLLIQSFAKAEAYSVAKDISIPPDEQKVKSAESAIRKQLGATVYLDSVRGHIVQILTLLFRTLGDMEGFDRALAKRGDFSAAKDVLAAICSRSQSTTTLPAGQQPSFRAKYLVDEIDFFCQRIDVDLTSIWTPALLVHIYRTLLDDAVPALGPLHASSVIRKLRIVVCFAGLEALQGYPLEMLLHALRPYLTNFHCSEDALGLFWYLIEHAKHYLQINIRFLAGISVSTFAALSKFMKSSQDSTTQESQFRTTLSKAQTFHDWFETYLRTLKLVTNDQDQLRRFQQMTKLAAAVSESGSNVKGSAEGDLLYMLLEDQSCSAPLLDSSAFRQAMELLCTDFRLSTEAGNDILPSIGDTAHFAPVIRTLLHEMVMPDSFRTWAAQIFGRTYASIGAVATAIDPHTAVDEHYPIRSSYLRVIQHLEAVLRQDNPLLAGCAERTLQLIASRLSLQDRRDQLGTGPETALFRDLAFTVIKYPEVKTRQRVHSEASVLYQWNNNVALEVWASGLVRALCDVSSSDVILLSLALVINELPSLAVALLPAIVHIVLSAEINQQQPTRQALSVVFTRGLNERHLSVSGHQRLMVDTLLYLRRMPMPREATFAERNDWLEVDLATAATASLYCGMPTAALLFLELYTSQQSLQSNRSSRRSSTTYLDNTADVVPNIFQSLPDPDFFYGVEEPATMPNLVKKLAHEGFAQKMVSFQSALYDTAMKMPRTGEIRHAENTMFSALTAANFDGLADTLQKRRGVIPEKESSGSAVQVSLNLQQWDLPSQRDEDSSFQVMLDVFQVIGASTSIAATNRLLERSLSKLVSQLSNLKLAAKQSRGFLASMAILTEMKEIINVASQDDVEEVCGRFEAMSWSNADNFDNVSPTLLGREALFSVFTSSEPLQSVIRISPIHLQLLEARAIRSSLKIARGFQASQFCLNRAVHLSQLSQVAAEQGLKIDGTAQHQMAKVLWDHGESSASIQMFQRLHARDDLAQQDLPVSSAEILADLGHAVAEARLEKPDEIVKNYLLPAIKELNGRGEGDEAGRVFHNFAAFCDMQLKNADTLDDFNRIEKLRHRKEKEVHDLRDMYDRADKQNKPQLKQHFLKAQTWFKLDDEEYRRLKANRERLVQQCLENYLLSMRACDAYNNDVLRFLALWLDRSDSQIANAAVSTHLASVPSLKFAPLMNQLSSRILDQKGDFQELLNGLLFRICCDHPFHSLYQVFAASKSKGAAGDETAVSRHKAAGKLADHIMKHGPSGGIWVAVHNSSIAFVRLANERLPDKKAKAGSKVPLRELQSGMKLEQTIHDSHTKTPPPTMQIELRADRKYSSIPTFSKFDPQFSIAGGVSAPKIVTIIASDGTRHKLLLKGGNDDLRQDSIMEQVFEQVSNLLKDHRATRQRNLGIRTYKVIPLTPNAGIIEFVKATIPLHDFLLPAHQRYFPKDYKPSMCRKQISDAQTKSLPQRLAAYQTVCKNFHPVMRFFFMENFLDPDEWFQKRLNYSRSTAAVSMLGHVLGLGDRHGHNILLDQHTGEVVHIDLGVAFEAGRVLPVPEVVPFRLTRDLVDGMGLSGVDGVFRRCCNFTLEVLRKEQESVMTILDVLRYDPLYSWSLSPLRLQKMQEDQDREAAATAGVEADVPAGTALTTSNTGGTGAAGTKRDINEPSEADRALTVVAKKLGKSLSVEATVNELIQQATDEKNLACLYCGWAAYA